MKTIEDYKLNKEQIKACKKIEKAFKEAKAIGVRFIAKSADITAYTKETSEVMGVNNMGELAPYYSLHKCIDDSGADDMEYFPKGFFDK